MARFWPKTTNSVSERGYLVRTSASRPGVPGSNPIAAPKSYEVYPGLGILNLKIADLETLSHSRLLSFKKPKKVLWTIAKKYLIHLW